MQEMSIKNSIRSFGEIKTNKSNIISASEASNITLQLTRIGKMLDESVLKFTKRYLIIQTELEEMKREFVGDVSLISEYLNLTKKEIRYDKFDNITLGKYSNPINVPKMPNYESKILSKSDKKYNNRINVYNNNSNMINYNKKPVYNNKITNKKMMKNNKIFSPDNRKHIKGIFKEQTPEKNNTKENEKNKRNIKKSKKEILNSLPDSQTKAIYILLNSEILPYEDKLKLLPSKRIIFNQVSPNDIYNDTLLNIENKINLLKQESIEEEDKSIVEKLSNYPSKTAKTGLNFLNEQKENELKKNDNETNKKLLDMIISCLGDNVNEVQGENIKEIYNNLFLKYNVNSIKDLFLDVIYKRIYNDSLNGKLNYKDIEKIINSINNNKILISDNLVSNSNKIFSYVAFSLDEILEFLNGIKDLDDDLKEKIKNEIEVKNLLEEEDKINNLIGN